METLGQCRHPVSRQRLVRNYGTERARAQRCSPWRGHCEHGQCGGPYRMPLGDILFKLGAGMIGKKSFKAAQIGGPSGGCVTLENLNVPTEYDALVVKLGAIMGSGGLIAMNEDACMVDTARYFMEFIQEESCGQCVACRLGTKRMLEILTRITEGRGVERHRAAGGAGQDHPGHMCGLGQTAPGPVLSTIRYFRQEYEEHIHKKYCRAGVCSQLFLSPLREHLSRQREYRAIWR